MRERLETNIKISLEIKKKGPSANINRFIDTMYFIIFSSIAKNKFQ